MTETRTHDHHDGDRPLHGAQDPDDVSVLEQVVLLLEDVQGLDALVDLVRPWPRWLTAGPVRRALLQGAWLGHRLHPVLTDLPIGFLTSATVLDVAGGEESAQAADTLVALGVLSAVPAALTGWADWASAPRRTQRVGVVHAVVNGAAVGLYAVSLLQRRRGKRTSGIALGLVAGSALGVGGFLGGHMAKPGAHLEHTDQAEDGTEPSPNS